MLTFKNYLKEAAFGAGNINRAIRAIERVLEKRLGRLYRWGGDNGIQLIQVGGVRGVGYQYFLQNGRGFRFNYAPVRNGRGKKIVSLYIWKQYKFGKDPDFVVDVEDYNIVQIIDGLVDIIKNPQKGSVKIPIKEDVLINDDLDFLSEAKQVTVAQFREIVKDDLGRINNLTRQEIKDVAKRNNVGVPTVVFKDRNFKERRGRFTLDIENAGMTPKASSESKPKKDDDGIELFVLGRDRKYGNKFFKPSPEQVEDALNKEVKQRVTNDTPSKAELDDPDTLFGNLKILVGMVAKGTNPSLLVYGGPGTGKTFVINQTLKENGKAKGKDYVVVKGKTTASGIYRTLYINRHRIVVFDDSDSVFRDQDSRNILKAALDSYDERVLSWVSNRTVNVTGMDDIEKAEFEAQVDEKLAKGEDAKLPSEFNFDGGIIFISNLKEDQIEPAILSRSFKIDMTLTDTAMFKRMASIIEFIGGGEFDDISVDQKENILSELKKRNALGELTNPNMRTFVAAMRIYQSGVPNWFDLLEYT